MWIEVVLAGFSGVLHLDHYGPSTVAPNTPSCSSAIKMLDTSSHLSRIWCLPSTTSMWLVVFGEGNVVGCCCSHHTINGTLRDKLFCALTCQLLTATAEAAATHMQGKRFKRHKGTVSRGWTLRLLLWWWSVVVQWYWLGWVHVLGIHTYSYMCIAYISCHPHEVPISPYMLVHVHIHRDVRCQGARVICRASLASR